MFSNAVWWAAVQGGKARSHSLVVRGVNTLVYSVSAGRNVAMYRVSPRKPLMLVAVVGCGQAAMRSILRGSARMPAPEMMCLRKQSSVANRVDFASLQ